MSSKIAIEAGRPHFYVGMPLNIDETVIRADRKEKHWDSEECDECRTGTCADTDTVYYPDDIDKWPVAMAYVPWQRFENLLCDEDAFDAGTIFAALDLPFRGGGHK